MSAGCDPKLVRDECAARGLDRAATLEVIELVEGLVAGSYDGRDRSTTDEPAALSKGKGPPPENDEPMEYLEASDIATKAVEAVDGLLGPWKLLFDSTAPAVDLLEEIGLDPFVWFPPAVQDQICEGMAERQLSYTPTFFGPDVVRAGAEEVLRVLSGATQ